MAKLVVSAIVIWDDIAAEFDLDRILNKAACGLLMNFSQLSNKVCTFLYQFAFGLLEQFLVKNALESFQLLDFASHCRLLAHQSEKFGLELRGQLGLNALNERVKLLTSFVFALLHFFDCRLHFVNVAVELTQPLSKPRSLGADRLYVSLVDNL